MPGAVLAFGFLLVGIAIAVGLYLIIADETAEPTVLDGERAEREAQARGGHDPEPNPDAGRER